MTWATDVDKLKIQIEYWYTLLAAMHTTHYQDLLDYQPEGVATSFGFPGYVERSESHLADQDAIFVAQDDFSYWLENIAVASINPGDDTLIEEMKKHNATGTSPSTISIHTFTAAANTITRGAGSYVVDGFQIGDFVYAESDGYFYRERVTNVVALTITLAHNYRGTTSATHTIRRIQTIESEGVAVGWPQFGSSLGNKLAVFMKKYDQYDYVIETPKRTQAWTFEVNYDLHDDSSYDFSGEFIAMTVEGVQDYFSQQAGCKEHYNGITVINSGEVPGGNLIETNNSFQRSFNATSGFAGWAKDTLDAWANCSQDTVEYLHYTKGTRTKTNIVGTGHSCEWVEDHTMTYYALNNKSFDEHIPYLALMFFKYFDTRAGDATIGDGSKSLSLGSLTTFGPTDGIKTSSSYYTGVATFAASPSTIVVGAGAAFLTEFCRGDLIWNEVDDPATYAVEIMDVVGNDDIRLKEPYTGTAGAAQEIGGQNSLSGTCTFAAGTALVGAGTHFLSEVSIGDIIWNATNDTIADARIVKSIESDTALTFTVAYAGTAGAAKEYSLKCTGWHWLSICDYLEYFWQDNLNLVMKHTGWTAGSNFYDNIILTSQEFYPEIGAYLLNAARGTNLKKGDSYTVAVTNPHSSKIQRMLALYWGESFCHYSTPAISDP